MKNYIKVNLACGDIFLSDWLNFDYSPTLSVIKKVDLLGTFPISSDSAEIVYSSHFLEHIPKNKVLSFLSECFRITAPNGTIRLVLPDFEEMCRTYLYHRKNFQHEKADFLIIEIIDQYSRTVSGGELGKCYKDIIHNKNKEMINFISERTGHFIADQQVNKENRSRTKKPLLLYTTTIDRIKYYYYRLIINLLPKPFQRQNISFASIGENHRWAYDFHTVEQLLLQVGYRNVKRKSANESDIINFPFFPLDITSEGLPRKGSESMFIEAIKPGEFVS